MNTFKHRCKPHRTPWQASAYKLLFAAALWASLVGLAITAHSAFSTAIYEAETFKLPL